MAISPANAEAVAGGTPITFAVSGGLIVGGLSWSLDGPGSISPIDQLSASYVPPSSVPATAVATLAVSSGNGRRASAAITIRPAEGEATSPGDATLTISPPSGSVYAGASGLSFSASGVGTATAVSWSLSGLGSITVSGPFTVSYLPPDAVAADTSAVLTASLSNPSRSASATITVRRPLGTLTVEVNVPLGSGLAPQIGVTGPGSFSRTISSSQTFSSVLAGSYAAGARIEIVAGPIVSSIYHPIIVGAPAMVPAGGTSVIQANFALRPGSGHLWLVDFFAARLRAYSGSQLATSGSVAASIELATGSSSAPLGAAMGANGQLWVAINSFVLGGYSSASLATGSRPPDVALGTGMSGGFIDLPLGLAFDSSAALWLASNAPNGGSGYRRLLKYSAAKLAASAPNPAPEVTLRSPTYWFPAALAFDASGNLWVADSANNKLLRFNREQLGQDGMPPSAVTLGNSAPRVPLNVPVDLAFDSAGNLWVANASDGPQPGTVIMYTPTQAAAGGSPNPSVTLARSSLRAPRGLAFDNGGGLWMGINQGLVRYGPSQITSSGEPVPQTIIRDAAIDTPMAVLFDPPGAATPLFR